MVAVEEYGHACIVSGAIVSRAIVSKYVRLSRSMAMPSKKKPKSKVDRSSGWETGELPASCCELTWSGSGVRVGVGVGVRGRIRGRGRGQHPAAVSPLRPARGDLPAPASTSSSD